MRYARIIFQNSINLTKFNLLKNSIVFDRLQQRWQQNWVCFRQLCQIQSVGSLHGEFHCLILRISGSIKLNTFLFTSTSQQAWNRRSSSPRTVDTVRLWIKKVSNVSIMFLYCRVSPKRSLSFLPSFIQSRRSFCVTFYFSFHFWVFLVLYRRVFVHHLQNKPETFDMRP